MPRGIYPRNQQRSREEAEDRASGRVENVKQHENEEQLQLFIKIVNNLTELSPEKDWKWAARTTLDLIERKE